MSVDHSNVYPEMPVVFDLSDIQSGIRFTNSSVEFLNVVGIKREGSFQYYALCLVLPLHIQSPEFTLTVMLLSSMKFLEAALVCLGDCLTNVIIMMCLFLVVLYVVPHSCRSPITSSLKSIIDGY